jgi:hypothetical protein
VDNSPRTTQTEPRRITAWVCDECDYWRQDKASGVHQTFTELSFEEQKRTGRRNALHTLREATFVEETG